MEADHMENCGCVNCMPYKGNHNFNNLEDKTKASYYLDSTMYAKKPITVFTLPDETSAIVKQYAKGSNVGKIYSYVLRDGVIWWELNWFSGKHQGWVKHNPALFDKQILEATSSGKKIEDKTAELKAMEENNPLNKLGKGLGDAVGGIGESLSFVGDSMKYILIAVILAAIAYLVYKFKD